MFKLVSLFLLLSFYIGSQALVAKSRASRQASCAAGTIGSSGGSFRTCETKGDCGPGFACNGAVKGKKNSGTCCADPGTVCNLAAEAGSPCTGAVQRWYYDKRPKTCRTFQYFGCGGNPNNFVTKEACLAFCQS